MKAGGPFSDDAVPLPLLRQRAFNSRWAQQPADVIPLTAADPDFPVCEAVQDRLVRYVRDGVFGYGPPEGLPAFREAVAEWMFATRGIACDPGAVLATDSAAAAIALVARASLRSGDEVLIPDPVDFLFQHAVQRAGAEAIRVPIGPTTDAQAFIAAMALRLTPRTRMLWLCNPHNPLGRVFSRPWLHAVAHWAVAQGLRILSDEIWSDIVYPPHSHVSVAALGPQIARRTVTVYGFSKNFALAGLRIGCTLCTDPSWHREIVAASDVQSTVSGVSVLSQVAAVAAIEDGRPWLRDFVGHLHAQRDHVLQRLSQWPGVRLDSPQGTYVAFPNIEASGMDAQNLCEHLLQHARVALVPGSTQWFGPGAQGHVRICFATSRRIVDQAFDRLDNVMLRG